MSASHIAVIDSNDVEYIIPVKDIKQVLSGPEDLTSEISMYNGDSYHVMNTVEQILSKIVLSEVGVEHRVYKPKCNHDLKSDDNTMVKKEIINRSGPYSIDPVDDERSYTVYQCSSCNKSFPVPYNGGK